MIEATTLRERKGRYKNERDNQAKRESERGKLIDRKAKRHKYTLTLRERKTYRKKDGFRVN